MGEIVEAFRLAFNDLAPARTDDELTTLRKSYAAVLDQKRALLQEIERLRALITAWADAEDTVENDFQFRDWEALDRGDDERELEAARAALRKAVGR